MDFFGIGPLELVVILLVALVALGPGRMTEAGRKLGRFVREVRRATSQVPRLEDLLEEPGEGEEERPALKHPGGTPPPGDREGGA